MERWAMIPTSGTNPALEEFSSARWRAVEESK
jgi:hypothetical protein